MPSVKLDINTGIEFSPTDGIDSAVKLHNFIVGSDGSLYKTPILKNLKRTKLNDQTSSNYWPFRLLDIQKFQTSSIEKTTNVFANEFHSTDFFRRFVYLTTASYGCINVNHEGTRIKNTDLLATEIERFGEFEYEVYNYEKSSGNDIVDLSSLGPKILVDLNAQYGAGVDRPIDTFPRVVFPAQHMFVEKETTYKLLFEPRNIISCVMKALEDPEDPEDPDILALLIKEEDDPTPDERRTKNDLARGCVNIGNRMVFYSALDNAFYFSKPANFSELHVESPDIPYIVIPKEQIQGLTDFNGNLITFTPTGMDRWVLSPGGNTDVDDQTVIQQDPTFHFDHRVRYSGSFVKAERELYYYTDDFRAYKLKTNLSVEPIFSGSLPTYKPLESYLNANQDLPMAHFKMLGFLFVTIGPWLFNIDTNTWSTYSYDGWKGITEGDHWIFENDTSKRVVNAAYDDIICTYNCITRALSYKQMQELSDDIEQSLDDPDTADEKRLYQWGDIAFFTTRMYQDEKTFSLDGIQVHVRGGILSQGTKIWVKILEGDEQGDFDEDDETTFGVEGEYAASNVYGEQKHVAKFIWRSNIKTDRFRLQVITNEKKGIVIQAVMVNITNIEDSQKKIEM